MFWRITKGVVALALLSLIFTFIPSREAYASFASANPSYVIAGGLLAAVHIGIRAYKWHTMLRAAKESANIRESVVSLLFGISLGSLTPGEVGELGGRALHVEEVHKAHIVGLTLVDRLQMFLVIAMAGSASLFILYLRDVTIVVPLSILTITTGSVAFFRMSTLKSLADRLFPRGARRDWWHELLRSFDLLTPSELVLTFVLTVITYVVLCVQIYLFLNAFFPAAWHHAVVGYSTVLFLKSFVPVSFGDLGVREAGAVYFFSFFSIPRAAALNASLMMFLFNVVLPGLIGSLFIPRTGGQLLRTILPTRRERH